MGLETKSPPASDSSVPASDSSVSAPAPSTPLAKRGRDPEDEVYIDNLNSHKRYLSEIMASSLNGLSVGDNLAVSLVDSPRSESMCYIREDVSLQYSPMSEDSDELAGYDVSMNVCSSSSSSQPESTPTSPVSPYRHQRPTSSNAPLGCNLSSNARQRGSSDSECHFPSSPSDICHSADLRRAALLRSVQMRTQPHGTTMFDLSLSHHTLNVDEGDYQICSESGNLEKHCGMSVAYEKGDTSSD